jgi:Methyltransferase domain
MDGEQTSGTDESVAANVRVPASIAPTSTAPATAVDYFSSQHPLRRAVTEVAWRARRKMFQHFMDIFQPTPEMTVLDVGVTPDRVLKDSNFFERLYPYPARLTASSIEDASFLEQDYPGLTFVKTTGVQLPFADGKFDLVFCSAVVEHVGTAADQQSFVAELARVGKACYVTTPNRWFPIEVHTFLPLIHWLPQHRHQSILRRIGKPFWADTANLNLLSAHTLAERFPATARVDIVKRRLLGMTSNLVAVVNRPAD